MSTEPIEMVNIPRAELAAMRAELRRLRLVEDRAIALARMKAHPRPDAGARTSATAEDLAQAMGLRARRAVQLTTPTDGPCEATLPFLAHATPSIGIV